ncbi:MAG: hypothetical protein GF388_04410 [Candidatus Aegiribacteria sp.]|nr:hypothetical protein [Candidatus Aegiribacteria sp.]MBD3294478.1 hypothetical protein [Candidatus Fermentibacteria bacterium]
MKYVVLFLMITAAAAFSTVLFSDNFDDGNADGWLEIPSGADYNVVSGRYTFFHSGPDSVFAASGNSDLAGSMSVADYSCRANLISTQGDISGLVIRTNPYLETGYGFFLNFESNVIMLMRGEGLGQGTMLSYQVLPLAQDQEYWMRFEINGDLMGAKIWTGAAGDEPSVWNLTATDSSYPDPGIIGLFSWDDNSGGTAITEVSFDDVEVTDEITLVMENATWADIKTLYGQ